MNGGTAGLFDGLHPSWCLILDVASTDAVFSAMSAAMCADLEPKILREYRAALASRERVTTTALGGGIAIPHARMPLVGACRIGLGVVARGIDMAARDGQPVTLIAMLLSREEDHPGHLRLLASVASRLADRGRRERMRLATSSAALMEAFTA